jgi:hypothetical protein
LAVASENAAFSSYTHQSRTEAMTVDRGNAGDGQRDDATHERHELPFRG